MEDESTLIRRHINVRLREKRMNASAQAGILWMFIVASSLCTVFLLRTAMRIASSGIEMPWFFVLVPVVFLGCYFCFIRAAGCIGESDVTVAAEYMKVVSALGLLAMLLQSMTVLRWFAIPVTSSRQTLLAITTCFFVINVGVGIFSAWRMTGRLASFEINSMNPEEFRRTRIFWNFLIIKSWLLLAAFVLLCW